MFPAFSLAAVMAVAAWLVPATGALVLTLGVKVLVGAGIYVIGSLMFRMEAFCYLLSILKEKIHQS